MKKLLHLINKILKENMGGGKKYIYPMGERGMFVYDILKNYDIENVQRVDNNISKWNDAFVSMEVLNSKFEDNDLLIVTSWSNEVIGCVHEFIAGRGKNTNVVFAYDREQMIKEQGLRRVHLADISDEIYKNAIKGSVAEAGVYKGEFAKDINLLFPDRKMYLFDSFDGFDVDSPNVNKDDSNQFEDWIKKLKDTSVELVLSKMKYPERIIIKQGFIPDTFDGIDDRFAFVSLDMDLYQPTLDGLRWFWPRMERGGCIFVHDYLQWEGVRQAVIEFCDEVKVGYFVMADQCSACISC